MYQFYGTYSCKVDSKGRLRLPSDFLDQLPVEDRDNFIVKQGFESCLILYPKKVWDQESTSVSMLNDFDTESRLFKRQYFHLVSLLRKDNADRLNFPNGHLQWANIETDVVFHCVTDKIEIWEPAAFEEHMRMTQERYLSLAQKLMGGASVRSLQGEQ